MFERLNTLREELRPLRLKLTNHKIYDAIRSIEDLHVFMEHHIYAVWDFMSLLKALQMCFTCVTVPWLPPTEPEFARLINEIVLIEESDRLPDGRCLSHFDLYIEAMHEAGADTSQIMRLIQELRLNTPLATAIDAHYLPAVSAAFVATTWTLIQSNEPHIIASALALGREDLIPAMFQQLVNHLAKNNGPRLNMLAMYLQRHISVDEDEHFPMAWKLLEKLCEDDESKWLQVEESAKTALQARLALWDGVLKALEKRAVLHS